jgi:gliding motility-associated-like protein
MIGRLVIPGTVIMGLLFSSTVVAQPICSIDLGPDHVICQGETVLLEGPPGFPNYLWSTGSTAQNITVGATGTYQLQASYPSGELVSNGNFDQGNTGFTTEFVLNSNLNTGDGYYWVGTNAANHHPQFFGTGTGQFMMVNSGWPSALWLVWCQEVAVCPGQTYTLSFRSRTLSNATPARLQWWIDGVPVGPELTLPNFNQGWQTFNVDWTTPAGLTTANICLRAMSGEGIGNDFGLDDISMQGTIVLTDEVEVVVTPLPVVDLGPNMTLCAGETLTLDATVPGGIYVWQDNSTNSTFTVSNAGTYGVVVTANGCNNSDQVTVNYNPLPVVDLGPDQTLCAGETTVLSAAQPGATYTWQNGSTSSTFTVTNPGTYSVDVLLNGCAASDAVNIAYNPLPVVDLGPDQTLCAGNQVILDATTAGGSYLWQDGSTQPTFTASTTGTYSVQVTVNGCSASDAVQLTFTPLPVVDLGPDQTVCPGVEVMLDATVLGGTYLWQDGSAASTYSIFQPGTYSVTVTANGCSITDAVTITHFPLPPVALGPDVTICQGTTTTLNSNVPGATYQWSTGATTQGIATGVAGIYWVDVTQNGCTARDSITVNVTPLPVVNLGGNQFVCPGDVVVLDATTPGGTYAWSTGATTPTINAGPGNYVVQVTVNGCSAPGTASVLSHPAAQVTLGNDTTLCPGDELLLDVGQAGASYLWQDGSTNSNFLVTGPGVIEVTLTDANGCQASDEVTVSYAQPQPVDLGADVAICQGDSWILDATTPGASYLWTTGAVTPTITVTTAGNYGVTVTQGSCTVSDDINVQVLNAPVVDLGPDVTLCPGDELLLDATQPGATYLWSTGAVTPSITVAQGGTYEVTVSNVAGCEGSDAITVVYANPDAIDLGPDVTLCAGQSITLDATLPGATYTWSTGATTSSITASTTGTFWVEVQQGLCSVSDTINVQVLPAPQVDLGPDLTLCDGESTVLDATWPGATYLWNTGATSPTITVAAAGDYSVTVDLNGCIDSDDITIAVLTPNSLDLGPDQTICDGDQVVLDATTPGASYTWSTGSTAPSITVTAAGTYWVEVQQGICSVSDTIGIQVLPAPQVDLGADLTLCDGESTVLDATWPGATYLWNTGATSPTITVTNAGDYSVTVDLNGCSVSDEITVAVLTTTSLDLGGDQTLCAGDELVLDAATPGATYSWSTGAATPTITVTTAGSYWVEVQQGTCSSADTVTITVFDPGTIDLGPDTQLCEGESLVLDATLAGATYLWNTGATSATLQVNTTGTFSVEATVGACTVTDAIQVTFNPLPLVDIGPDVEICPGTMATFDATLPGATYLWGDGSTGAQYSTDVAGMVTVTVTVNGCSAQDQAEVSLVDGPVASLGNDTTLCDGEQLLLNVAQQGATYLWDDGHTGPDRTISSAGTFWVEVQRNDCIASDTITVDLFLPASIDLGGDATLCAGNSLTLDATAPGAIYLWSTGATSPTITVTQGGTYAVTVLVSGCSASDTITVQVVDLPVPDLGGDRTICDGESVVLSVDPNGANVLWSTGSTANSITVGNSGVYMVTLEADGCSATDAVQVTVLPSITMVDLGMDRPICPGTPIILDATTAPGASYLWNTGSTAPTLSVSAAGIYSVEVSGPCISASASVTIFPGDCDAQVFVPNSFTPNGDGLNDVFRAVVTGELLNFRLDIFNRWGEIVHTSIDPTIGWDGRVNGSIAQDGVYVWTINYKAITDQGISQDRLVGHVSLLR